MSTFSLRSDHSVRPMTMLLQLLSLVALILMAMLCMGIGYAHTRDITLSSVQSGSMEPRLSKGDLVLTEPVAASTLAVGDIITYASSVTPSVTVTHRITAIDTARHVIHTKGDANAVGDKAIRYHQVIGKVDTVVPVVGALADAIRYPLGLVIIIYVPSLLVIIAELQRLAAYYRTQQTYRLRMVRSTPFLGRISTGDTALALKGLALVVAGLPLLGFSANAAYSNSPALAGNTIATISLPVSYAVCNFPMDNSLLSYSPVDGFIPKQDTDPLPLGQTIRTGRYRITASYFDDHRANPNEPSQPNERWFAQLYTKGAAVPAYTTGVTDDLPDIIDEAATVVNDAMVISQPLTGVRYIHNAAHTDFEKERFGNRQYDDLSPDEKRQVLWNSIHPKCLTFERTGNAAVIRPE